MNFDLDADTLDAEAKARLDEQAEWIIDHPFSKLRVYGHTDMTGPENYNDDLGQRRADQVVAYLVSQGIDENRLEVVLSFGESFPLVATESRERANRRVVTDVTGIFRIEDDREDKDEPAPERSAQFIDTVPPIDENEESQDQEFVN